MAWTDERVELLKTLWAEGLSAAQIANKMGGVTRNAVIGKVHRLGLSGRATPAKPQRGRSLSPERKEESVEPKKRPMEMKSVIPEPEFIAPLVLDTGDKTTVSTIANNMCKWPIGDPAKDDFHFCGQSTVIGKSYCAYHAHIAFQPPVRREARREPRRVLAPAEKRRAAS